MVNKNDNNRFGMEDYLDTFIKFQEKLYFMDEYRLTMDELVRMCRDFKADCYDGFVSNDRGYLELWLSKNGIDEI